MTSTISLHEFDSMLTITFLNLNYYQMKLANTNLLTQRTSRCIMKWNMFLEMNSCIYTADRKALDFMSGLKKEKLESFSGMLQTSVVSENHMII